MQVTEKILTPKEIVGTPERLGMTAAEFRLAMGALLPVSTFTRWQRLAAPNAEFNKLVAISKKVAKLEAKLQKKAAKSQK